jgi:hyperosmotically inducible protein
MKTAAWTVVPLFALLTLVSAPAGAGQKDAIVKGTKNVVDWTKDGVSKTGEVMTDTWITTRIHARFVDEDLLKDSDISVDVSHHVVTLKGTVMGRLGRSRAITVAQRTEGVRRVVNHMTIGPKHANREGASGGLPGRER